MRELFATMARQHGVATVTQARGLGLSRKVERRLVADGVLAVPYPGVLTTMGMPERFESRAMAAVLGPGALAIAHGASCRLHRLDGFEHHDLIDIIGLNGAIPDPTLRATFHQTRGPVADHVVEVDRIPTLSIPLTLTLLAPMVGIGRTARALDAALRRGVEPAALKAVASSWRRRGRSGPPALLMLLGERIDKRIPRSWFQRLASRVFQRHGIRLVDEYPVRDHRGILLAELDLADPVRKVGVECQSWEWHASPDAQHRDARRKGAVRMLGWEIVDIWWSDLKHPDRVLAELNHLLAARTPTGKADSARSGRIERAARSA